MHDEEKIKALSELSHIIEDAKTNGKRVGLICGCFDILHIGHLRLFKFAKSYTDLLIVGLDNDMAIAQTKGKDRPIHSLSVRMEVIAALTPVDYVFPLDFASQFGVQDSHNYWESMLETLNPDVLFTCPQKDRLHDDKKDMADKLGIEFLPYSTSHDTSTSEIADILCTEL